MIELLKEVGRGKRGARDLTYEEAIRGAEMILDGSASPVQVGAFLVAERIKMESIDEIHAFVDACRARAERFPIAGGIDCAGPYDGRSRSFYATLPTAFVLAACGLPATLHGGASLPPKWGVTLFDVLEQLGLQPSRFTRDGLVEAASATGFLFVPTERWCPPLQGMRAARQELGLRTVFNTVEKLLRPTDAPFMAVGVFHGTVFEKTAQLLSKLGVQRGMIIQGMEGSEDLPVDKRTRTYLIRDGVTELYIIDPEMLELQTAMPEEEWTAAKQAEVFQAVLRGEADLAYHNAVLLNSGVRLWISGLAGSIEEGIYKARHAIIQGHALQKFKQWSEMISVAQT